MDPSVIPTLAAVISAIIGGAAGEAGKNAWTSLTALIRRRFADDDAVTAAIERAETRPAEETAEIIAGRAATDPAFEEALHRWTVETARLVQSKHDVSNTISGNARISGPVLQAGDVFGSINLGKP
ncbi:hypothetical protein ETD86_12255 [Nonomuraea turkmeniaca]|uniref:Uncharacterized protein n=1 Tax=Nonomuraea turkmeniaca TaxID=103838 RepID=A0A5S4FPV1_9ACTN|nr:hypothetical protein [Nonomuraea turkmeniaca]TMR22211.1 hypothetical protein ETD86_12255 [Nonomuraea turkmeniaca]